MSYDLYPTINTEGSEDALKKLVKKDKALGKGEKEERNAWLSLVESAMVYPGMSLLFAFITFFLPSLPPSRMFHICHPSVRSGKINPNPLETTLSLSDSQLFDTNITIRQILT